MKDLQEILREKEQAIKRLEKEIEAIRVVLGILDEETRTGVSAKAETRMAPPPPPQQPPYPSGDRGGYSAAAQNGLPPIPAPFSVASPAQPEAPILRKGTTRNWP